MAGRAAFVGTGDAAVVLRLQAEVLSHQPFEEAATAFATRLSNVLRCDRVSVGWLEGGCVRVTAMSHAASFDKRQALFEKIGAAMDEALEQGATVALPPAEGSPPLVTLAHGELLAELNGGACSVPLVESGRALGALTLERAGGGFSAAEAAFCEHTACLVAPLLALKRKSERSWLQHTRDAAGAALAQATTPGHWRSKVMLAGTAIFLLAAAVMPLPYDVGAPARLEGSIQRVVAAPVDGFLQQVNVRPGDTVRAGSVLAELAMQDLQTERAKRHSELVQHENLYQAALARADRAQFVINHAKAAEAQAQLSLVENQLRRAKIQAPFDGIVIKGDLSQSLGAPVRRGEVLLTLAPDERFRLIVEVDERDIARIGPGQRGKLALAALPHETLAFKVARILPAAVAGEGRNFFEVEAKLEATDRTLRPGLSGVAKIRVDSRPAIWILTHRLVDWIRLAWWALGA